MSRRRRVGRSERLACTSGLSERLVQRSCDAPRRIGVGPPERLGGLVVLLDVSHQRPLAAPIEGDATGEGFRGQDSEARTRPSQARPARLLSPGCAGDGQVGRAFGRRGPSCSMMRPTRANKPNAYLLGSYRIATAPEPNSSRLTSLKSTCFDSPANNVGPWPASLGCTTNSYSSINPSSVNASGSFTPPTNTPLPDSRLSC